MEKTRTEKELAGVSKILQEVVWEAWVISKQPFVCTDGLRTVEEQKLLVAKGASKTMNSKHIEGKAVDLTPFIGSKPKWEMTFSFFAAAIIASATTIHKVPLRWGGAWHCADVTKTNKTAKELHEEYIRLCRSQKKTPFIDGPHYELV